MPTLVRALRFTTRHAALAAALVATAAVSTVLTMRIVLSARDVVVPPLVGRSIPEAGARAADTGLLVRVEGRRNDPKVPKERVVAQEPAPGATLKAHRAVRIWISSGPRRITVPALEGQSERSARLALEQSGVPFARAVEVEGPAPEGTVIAQRPPAGEVDASGAGVSLLVSRGPGGTSYVMPDLIGRPVGPVLDALRAAGLKVEELRYATYPGVAPGIVLRQFPQAGHKVDARIGLSLHVSKGES